MSIEESLKNGPQLLAALRRCPIALVLFAAVCLAGPFLAWPVASLASEDAGAPADEGIASNLELVRRVAGEAVGGLLADLPSTSGRVLIRIEPYHETAWLVEDLVGRELRSRGLEVVTASAPGGALPPATPPPAEPGDGDEGESPLERAARAQAAGDTTGAEPESAGGEKEGEGSEGDASGAGDSGGGSVGDSGSGDGSESEPGAAGESEAKGEETGAEKGAATGGAAALPAADAELSLRVIELGLSYTGSHRTRPLFGKQRIERFASARLHGELRTRGDAALRWSGDGESMVIDEVPSDTIKILEGQRYPFTAPTLPKRNLGRVIEPLVVSAIVVGLVFLFVSNRS